MPTKGDSFKSIGSVSISAILLVPLVFSLISLSGADVVVGENAPCISCSSPSVYADFNGDQFDDLAIGAPGEQGIAGDAGAVNVLFGSASGLQTSSPADQFWSQDSPDVEDSAESLDLFGTSLAAGDFNGDGFDDMAVGVPFEDIGALGDAGAVNVLYGSASGLQTALPADQFWSQDSPDVDSTAEAGDEFGRSLAAGDFNGDGFDDLAIGVHEEDLGTTPDAGVVNVLFGSASGLQTSSPADQFWHQNRPGVDGAAEPNDFFGRSLAAGDFNNDGKDDLAIGVPLEGAGSIGDAGAVNVLYGSASGLQTSSPGDQLWYQGSPGVNDIPETGDEFGSSLAAGDLNGDGFDDLAVAVRLEDTGTISNAGAVNVLFGSASGLQTSSPADQFWHQNRPGVDGASEQNDLFGSSLVIGDFNGDGKDDLAVGVAFEGLGTISEAGAVNVLYGSASGLQTSSPADQLWHQGSPGVDDIPESGDGFGTSLAAGDFDGDGKDDLAVGVPYEDIDTLGDAGAVNVLFGSASGLQTSSPADQFWSQDSPDVEDTAADSDQFGLSLA